MAICAANSSCRPLSCITLADTTTSAVEMSVVLYPPSPLELFPLVPLLSWLVDLCLPRRWFLLSPLPPSLLVPLFCRFSVWSPLPFVRLVHPIPEHPSSRLFQRVSTQPTACNRSSNDRIQSCDSSQSCTMYSAACRISLTHSAIFGHPPDRGELLNVYFG